MRPSARSASTFMGTLLVLPLLALLSGSPVASAGRALSQVTHFFQLPTYQVHTIDFGIPGLALPPRYIFPGQEPTDRERAFVANMTALYQSDSFMKMPSTSTVNPMSPRPEHPRPQLQRAGRWESLNGPWQFDVGKGLQPQFGVDLPRDIIVPFSIESPLSGINLRGPMYSDMLYRRLVTPTLFQPGERMILHVDRADWNATVFVNGKLIGSHQGGYDRFSFDITDAAFDPSPFNNSIQANEIVILVHDDTEWAVHPLGKQRAAGTGGILYTSTSGIWGDVWLEYVPVAHLTDFYALADVSEGVVRLMTNGSAAAIGQSYEMAIFDWGNNLVTTASGVVGQPLDVRFQVNYYWDPVTPCLYNATLYFTSHSGNIVQMDVVETYFGMRQVSLQTDTLGGNPRLAINGRFEFHLGFLDQGYVPDGVLTYASDADMRADLQFMKDLGANTVRKHIKVESDRWYLYAAQLGLFVWQDMPSGCGLENMGQQGNMSFLNGTPFGWDVPDDHPGCWTSRRQLSDADKAQWRAELGEIVAEHNYSPAIVMYQVFNEAWGQFDTVPVVQEAMANLDPGMADASGTRTPHYMWNAASGWQDWEVGNMFDLHRYAGDKAHFTAPMRNPGNSSALAGYARSRAAVLGEFGGVKFPIEGHTWGDEAVMRANSQPAAADLPSLQALVLDELAWVAQMVTDPVIGLSGAIFTQPWDVEYEINGLATYDRAVTKIDAGQWRQAADNVLQQAQHVPFGLDGPIALPVAGR